MINSNLKNYGISLSKVKLYVNFGIKPLVNLLLGIDIIKKNIIDLIKKKMIYNLLKNKIIKSR